MFLVEKSGVFIFEINAYSLWTKQERPFTRGHFDVHHHLLRIHSDAFSTFP